MASSQHKEVRYALGILEQLLTEPSPENFNFRHFFHELYTLTGVSHSIFRGSRSHRRLALLRDVVYYVLHYHYDLSTPYIGALLHRDHSTVVTGYQYIEGLLERSRSVPH